MDSAFGCTRFRAKQPVRQADFSDSVPLVPHGMIDCSLVFEFTNNYSLRYMTNNPMVSSWQDFRRKIYTVDRRVVAVSYKIWMPYSGPVNRGSRGSAGFL